MFPALASLQQKIDGRVLRERVWILLCALAVIFMLWSLLVQNAIDTRQKSLQSQIEATILQRQALETQVAAIRLAASNDPDLPKKNMIAQLNLQFAEFDSQLSNLSQGLVSADQLPQILQDVLLKTGELTLVQLQTLPAQELQLVVAEQVNQNAPVAEGAGVFKHGVSLRVSGGYFQVVNFLQSLEQLPWRFYWEQLDYSVVQYPRADIELRVYTLSAEEGLLGV